MCIGEWGFDYNFMRCRKMRWGKGNWKNTLLESADTASILEKCSLQGHHKDKTANKIQ